MPKLRMPKLPADKQASKKKNQNRIIYLLIMIPLVFVILVFDLLPSQVSLNVGEIAAEDIFHDGSTVSYTSEIRTEAAINAAAAEVKQVYFIDDTVTTNLQAEIDEYAEALAKATSMVGGAEDPLPALKEALPGEHSNDTLYAMLGLSKSEQTTLFTNFKVMVRQIYDNGVGSEEIETARQNIALKVNASSSMTGSRETFFKSLVEGMDLPYNREYDAVATRAAQDEAMAAVTPVQVTIQPGQKLVSRGALITAEQLETLQAVGRYHENAQYAPYIGLLLLVGTLLTLLYIYLRQFKPAIYNKRSSMVLIGVVVAFVLLLCKLISLIQFTTDPNASLLIGFLLPVPVASLLLAVLLDRDVAALVTPVLAIFVGVIMDGQLAFAAVALAGGLTGVITSARLNQRSQFVGASLWIIIVNLLVIGGFGLFSGYTLPSIAIGSMFGLINGLLCAIIAMGVLPYFESMFGVTTVIRLLELSNSNNPMLKKLMMEAPGTYNHSILVGNLAEAAADAIGADALLVRVASYYHDIGKLKRPHFYIENQRPGENPHDKLQPALSAMIITSHPLDAAKTLRENRFPQEIIDIVEQHHGNSLLSVFYHKAKEEALDPADVKEDDYRYKGSRPKTKEAALVMLADSVQAGVQALGATDSASLEARVRDVINGKLNSGQLQDCPLTFRDLEEIAQSFLMVVSGINHLRISYPGQEQITDSAPERPAEAEAEAVATDEN